MGMSFNKYLASLSFTIVVAAELGKFLGRRGEFTMESRKKKWGKGAIIFGVRPIPFGSIDTSNVV